MNLHKKFKNLDGKEYLMNGDEKVFNQNMNEALANLLVNSYSDNPIKMWELAKKIHNDPAKFDIDEADKILLKEFINKAQVNVYVKAQLLLEIENDKSKPK